MVDERDPVLPLGNFLFPRIFQAFRMAIQPSKLVIVLAALTVICLVGWIMDLSRTVVVAPLSTGSGAPAEIRGRAITELDVYLWRDERGARLSDFIESNKTGRNRTGVFSTLRRFGADEFHSALYALFSLDIPRFTHAPFLCVRALVWAFRWHTLYSTIFFGAAFIVMSLAGGAICRVAALQLAKAERPRLMQAVRFGTRKSVNLCLAPITPIIGVILVALPFIALLGLIGNLPVVGELLVGIFLPLALLAGGFIAIVLIGTVAGVNLMFPAIAYEDSDFFDAIARAFAYVFARPWRMAFYTIIAALYGAIGYIFVRFFGFLVLLTTYRFLQVGFLRRNEKLHEIWPEPTFANFPGPAGAMPDTWSLWLAALLIHLWVLLIVGLVVSFIISFYFSANTIIYALLRYREDGTPLEEVYTSASGETAGPAPETVVPEPGRIMESKPQEKHDTSG